MGKRTKNILVIGVVGICGFIFFGVIYSFIYEAHLLENNPGDKIFGYSMLVSMPIMATYLLYFRKLLVGGKG